MAVKESGQSAAKRELSHAVKLFGMKISLSVTPADEDQAASPAELAKSEVISNTAEEIASFSASTSGSDDDKALKREEEEEDHGGRGGGVAEVPRRPEEQEDKRSGRPLKRPEKPVSCPRCHSLDTKFCYFNNYNVNQPRHFCKNCQRYWTAGGTLRNVPVGAGRRKNKNGRLENGGGGGGGAAAAAGSDLPPQQNPGQSSERKLATKLPQQDSSCKVSRASDAGRGGSFGFIRGFATSRSTEEDPSRQSQQQQSSTSEGSNDSRDDSTCGSSVSNPAQECREGGGGTTAWPYAFFNGTGPWNLPGWAGWSNSPWGSMAATAATAAAKVLAQNVHTALGKHMRDEKSVAGAGPAKRPEGSLWAPKTLRIDAQGDASRGSSFLADIATGSNKVDTISTGGMFKAFQQETSGTKPGPDDLDGHPKTASDTNKSSEGT
ncbi:hypothetical protein SELMODRAFT_448037 [Selaginella moellendorffii]|uniref:Uncharacterized protein CDF1C-1 n=1 Tax=Selaginella moellendorffii TaxID=88036 RepID=D8T4E1_SELML|nr:cyclic dof factor 3 [Selaginella moellendorffii]EFJ08555.1 hypothetical protein SELMODRAFT_448037 [Selaginella moellendorffii]|eukprot:XP_002990462.1 cyclic dof factor 3 [Selaginella moellendorffii]